MCFCLCVHSFFIFGSPAKGRANTRHKKEVQSGSSVHYPLRQVGEGTSLEVRIRLELRVQRQQHMHGLHEVAVARDIQQRTHHPHVLDHIQVDLRRRQRNLPRQQVLEVGRPHLQQRLQVRHWLRVVDLRAVLVLVQLLHVCDPLVDHLRARRGTLDAGHALLAHTLLRVVGESERNDARVALVAARLVEHCEAEVAGVAVRARHLDEAVDVADGRDVVGDEGVQLRFHLDLVRLVHGDELEQVLDLLRHVEVVVLRRVVQPLLVLRRRRARRLVFFGAALLRCVLCPRACLCRRRHGAYHGGGRGRRVRLVRLEHGGLFRLLLVGRDGCSVVDVERHVVRVVLDGASVARGAAAGAVADLRRLRRRRDVHVVGTGQDVERRVVLLVLQLLLAQPARLVRPRRRHRLHVAAQVDGRVVRVVLHLRQRRRSAAPSVPLRRLRRRHKVLRLVHVVLRVVRVVLQLAQVLRAAAAAAASRHGTLRSALQLSLHLLLLGPFAGLGLRFALGGGLRRCLVFLVVLGLLICFLVFLSLFVVLLRLLRLLAAAGRGLLAQLLLLLLGIRHVVLLLCRGDYPPALTHSTLRLKKEKLSPSLSLSLSLFFSPLPLRGKQAKATERRVAFSPFVCLNEVQIL
eukprot:Rhum_TRINITY_DN10256_c0_g1::Rhum_TRINITY_DN10256_c0_g1_i1::g.37572::m.37572